MQAREPLPPRLDFYFEAYCDYTGNMGIGFAPEQNWDYEFRHRLKRTSDPELKRLFVLQNLYRDVKFALRDLGAGRVRMGKDKYRPLSTHEWIGLRADIQQKINDLVAYASFTNFTGSSFDPMCKPTLTVDLAFVDELSQQLQAITNAPTQSKSPQELPH